MTPDLSPPPDGAATAARQPAVAPPLHIYGRHLSMRERETLIYVSQGHTSTEIAGMLCISRETIDTHRRNIMRKLRVNNLTHAVAYSLRNKIIE